MSAKKTKHLDSEFIEAAQEFKKILSKILGEEPLSGSVKPMFGSTEKEAELSEPIKKNMRDLIGVIDTACNYNFRNISNANKSPYTTIIKEIKKNKDILLDKTWGNLWMRSVNAFFKRCGEKPMFKMESDIAVRYKKELDSITNKKNTRNLEQDIKNLLKFPR